MPKNVHFTRNFEKRDETRNRDEKREVQNCRDPGKSSRRDETRRNTTVKDNGERISISDHEGLSAEYWIERKSSGGSGSTHCVKDASYDV